MSRLCSHCGIRLRMNDIGSLCEWCWRNVPNRHNSFPHDGRSCKLDCIRIARAEKDQRSQ